LPGPIFCNPRPGCRDRARRPAPVRPVPHVRDGRTTGEREESGRDSSQYPPCKISIFYPSKKINQGGLESQCLNGSLATRSGPARPNRFLIRVCDQQNELYNSLDAPSGHKNAISWMSQPLKCMNARRGGPGMSRSPSRSRCVTACRAGGPGWPGPRGARDPSLPKM
jgi:hypothetical protein